MFRLLRLGVISLFFLFLAGIVLSKYLKVAVVQDKPAIEVEPIHIGGPFELTDTQGKIRTPAEFQGKYMIVYFGYTYCPDICPMALANISEALSQLHKDRDQFVPIFITVDPKRDTVTALKTYQTHFDPNIVMLTGTQESIESIKTAYKVYAERVDDPKASDYLMDHSTLVYIMDRQGKFISSMPHAMPGKDMAKIMIGLLAKEHKNKSL